MALQTAVQDARRAYNRAEHEFARGGARAARQSAICATVRPEETFTDWVATIHSLSSTAEGWGTLTVELPGRIWLSTNSSIALDRHYETLVDPQSALFDKLANMAAGDVVFVSGNFFSSDTDCFKELSGAEATSMREPKFVARFSNVRRP